MNSFRLGTALAAVCIVSVAGCSSDNTSNNDGNSSPMSATINGTSFAATGSSFSYSGTSLSVAGTNLAYTITVSVGLLSAPGTYAIHATSPIVYFVVSKAPSSGWDTIGAGATGTVTITSVSATHVAGTFSFSAQPQSGTTGAMVVTQGSFNMTK